MDDPEIKDHWCCGRVMRTYVCIDGAFYKCEHCLQKIKIESNDFNYFLFQDRIIQETLKGNPPGIVPEKRESED